MNKKVFCLAIGLFILSDIGTPFAQSNNDSSGSAGVQTAIAPSSIESINVGNKICPVSGERVDSMDPVTCEYEGKIYNFCCSGCMGEFKKDPKKYIKIVEEELKGKKS